MVLKDLLKKFLIELITRLVKKLGWIIESLDVEYVNISTYSPLSGYSYIELST